MNNTIFYRAIIAVTLVVGLLSLAACNTGLDPVKAASNADTQGTVSQAAQDGKGQITIKIPRISPTFARIAAEAQNGAKTAEARNAAARAFVFVDRVDLHLTQYGEVLNDWSVTDDSITSPTSSLPPETTAYMSTTFPIDAGSGYELTAYIYNNQNTNPAWVVSGSKTFAVSSGEAVSITIAPTPNPAITTSMTESTQGSQVDSYPYTAEATYWYDSYNSMCYPGSEKWFSVTPSTEWTAFTVSGNAEYYLNSGDWYNFNYHYLLVYDQNGKYLDNIHNQSQDGYNYRDPVTVPTIPGNTYYFCVVDQSQSNQQVDPYGQARGQPRPFGVNVQPSSPTHNVSNYSFNIYYGWSSPDPTDALCTWDNPAWPSGVFTSDAEWLSWANYSPNSEVTNPANSGIYIPGWSIVRNMDYSVEDAGPLTVQVRADEPGALNNCVYLADTQVGSSPYMVGLSNMSIYTSVNYSSQLKLRFNIIDYTGGNLDEASGWQAPVKVYLYVYDYALSIYGEWKLLSGYTTTSHSVESTYGLMEAVTPTTWQEKTIHLLGARTADGYQCTNNTQISGIQVESGGVNWQVLVDTVDLQSAGGGSGY